MRKASAFTMLFVSMLFCFYRWLCVLVLPLEYFAFKEFLYYKKALLLYDLNRLLHPLRVVKSFKDLFASWLADA